MNRSATACLGVLATCFGSSVFAHGGHGVSAPASFAHYLIEPMHVLPVFAPLALIGATVWLLRARSR